MESLESAPDLQWDRPSRGVSLAVYLTCAAVAISPAWHWLRGEIPLTWTTVSGALGLLAVPLLFALASKRPAYGPRPPRNVVCRFAEAPAALLAVWGLNEPMLGALLAIAAGQLSGMFSLRITLYALIPVNLILLGVLMSRLPLIDAVMTMLVECSFQMFTVHMIHHARISQRRRDETLRINAELLATRQLLTEAARGEERLRISRELHDLVGHKLTALKLQLQLRDRTPRPESVEDRCLHLSDELLRDVRGVVAAMRESDGVDLHQALVKLIPDVPRPAIVLQLAPNARVPGLVQAHALLRCAQESLTNALRHSDASLITVSLRKEGLGVTLCVEDDGVARAAPEFGHGLSGMRERLVALGGNLNINVVTDHGLRVAAWLPQPEVDQAIA